VFCLQFTHERKERDHHRLPSGLTVQFYIHINVLWYNLKLIRYQFWCTRCAFRLLKSLQWYSGKKSWKYENHCENCIWAKKAPQILCHKIEPNPSKERALHEGDNPSFWDEFLKNIQYDVRIRKANFLAIDKK
jgi:hypothetical protein